MSTGTAAEARAVRRWLLAAAGAVAVLCGFAGIAPHAPQLGVYVAGAIAFAFVGAEVLAVSALTPPLRPRALLGVLAPIALLVAVGLGGSRLPTLAAAAIVTLALLVLGTLAGAVVGRAIEDPGHLLVVAVVSAVVDVFSVMHPAGPTAQLVEIDVAVDVLILPWPILGTSRIEPLLGIGDVAFAAIYAVATRRHGLAMRRTIVALAVGLAVTLAVVFATGAGTPALPFLGAAIVIAHPEARRLQPKDRRRALVGIGVLLTVFAILFALR